MSELQSSDQSAAQPSYILRGHAVQIHAVHFLRANLRLLTGDVDGWVVLWSLSTKRPVAVWRAHEKTVVGLGSWNDERIITHGRDNKVHVWQIRVEDEAGLSSILPISDSHLERPPPWLLHSLNVNALNFCFFAMCADAAAAAAESGILIGTPGVQDGHVNITSLPAEDRVLTISGPKDMNTGMVMAIALHFTPAKELLVCTGYESGHVCIWTQPSRMSKQYSLTYVHKSHSQPILSIALAPRLGYFYTSSADAVIARHSLSGGLSNATAEPKMVQTKHAGQQSLAVRSDEKIFATAGWDGRTRVYAAKTLKELAVLKWHKEGCYAVAFADVLERSNRDHVDENAVEDPVKRDLTVSGRRLETAKTTHWLAAGSKDGKVSLWDVY